MPVPFRVCPPAKNTQLTRSGIVRYNIRMEKLFENRMNELAERAFRENRYVYSDFLSESESAELAKNGRKYSYAGLVLFGGGEGCARNIARFGNLPYEERFPVTLLKISPKNRKFADELTHRDFLGALLSLGIERSTLGDIGVKEGCGYVFCIDRIAPFILENLIRVKHTDVVCAPTEERYSPSAQRRKEQILVSSLRRDCFVSAVFKLSRAETAEFFRSERVTLNGRPCAEGSDELKEGDCLAVRGKGKFYFIQICARSAKGKYYAEIELPL